MRFGESLLGPARKSLQKEALQQSYSALTIVPAMLGESIGDIAALCVAMGDEFHASPEAQQEIISA